MLQFVNENLIFPLFTLGKYSKLTSHVVHFPWSSPPKALGVLVASLQAFESKVVTNVALASKIYTDEDLKLSLPVVFQIPAQKVFGVGFWGPNTYSHGVWKPRVYV